MPILIVKNMLNDNLTIKFCVGTTNYVLKYDERAAIDIDKDQYLYLDVVEKPE